MTDYFRFTFYTKMYCPCSICLSYNQAGIYHCALCMLKTHTEPTFVRLRYALEGNRPSQTTNYKIFYKKKIFKLVNKD